MKIKLDINDRAALAIKNNEKRVEIRANTNYDYSKLNKNDVIEFNSSNLGIFYVKVKEVNRYNSLDELFTLEGTRYVTSSTNDKSEAIKNVEKLNGYKEEIEKSGVYAIHIEYLYSENTVWDELYEKVNNVRNSREVSGMINAGGVGASILTENHNIYTGVCIDTASTLGMCAERNAIANMITNGENKIIKLVCVDSKGNVGSPCGACREYLMQLDKNSKNIEILKNEKTKEIVRLEELIPDWWGYNRV
jgi:cytidine deaminase